VAVSLSGPYDSYFWTNLVLQLSRSEPIIRHAVIAISTLYEDFACRGRDLSRLQGNLFALSHYNTAVRKLREVQHEPIVLLACLLFICIEVFQDNKPQAITHCRHGLAILRSIQPTAVWARDYLTPIFQRLTSMPVIFGGYNPMLEPELPPLRPVPTEMVSMDEANTIAEELLNRTMQLICCGDEYRYGRLYGHEVSPILMARHAQLKKATQHFNESLERLGREILGQEGVYPPGLKMWYSCCEVRAEYCCIWGSLALDLDETSYDRFISRFSRITYLIRSLDGMMQQRELRHGPIFRFEISYLAIAHVTVMKCRDLATRLEALALVKTSGAVRESFWEADKMYLLGRRVIEVEHGLILDESDQPVGEVSWKDLPPENRRVRDSFFDNDAVLHTIHDGRVVSGKALGLIMRDSQGNIYLQYEFISVEPVSLASHLHASQWDLSYYTERCLYHQTDAHSRPILIKLDKAVIRPYFRQASSHNPKCIIA
jgi:hypothetical protein